MNNDAMKQHLIKALTKGARYDGRKLDQLREVKVEYGVSANAEGSAKVTMGDTVVLAGVKLALDKPYPDTPEQGNLMVNSELTPLSNPRFESGPPSAESIELARVVDRGIRESEAIDTKTLCLEKGEKVWSVSVDMIPLNAAGNLIDVAGLAAIAALKDAVFPEVDKDGVVDYKKKSKNKLPLSKEPLPVTVYLLGKLYVVDPTEEEEMEADARLTVASLADGSLCAMQKGGVTALSRKQISEMVDLALKKAAELRKAL